MIVIIRRTQSLFDLCVTFAPTLLKNESMKESTVGTTTLTIIIEVTMMGILEGSLETTSDM